MPRTFADNISELRLRLSIAQKSLALHSACTDFAIKKVMITVKDLKDIAENRIRNEAQKEIIRSSFPPHIADRMCAAIDGQEKMEHFIRFLNEYNEWMVQQQMVVQEFLREYYKG